MVFFSTHFKNSEAAYRLLLNLLRRLVASSKNVFEWDYSRLTNGRRLTQVAPGPIIEHRGCQKGFVFLLVAAFVRKLSLHSGA
jgi:hypothetical protein